MTFDVGGTAWEVIYTEAKTKKGLRGNEGLLLKNEHKIYINKDLVPPSRVASVVFHEMLHACSDISGSYYAVRQSLGIDEERMHELEELLIRTWGQAMFDTLVRNGWLTLPMP